MKGFVKAIWKQMELSLEQVTFWRLEAQSLQMNLGWFWVKFSVCPGGNPWPAA